MRLFDFLRSQLVDVIDRVEVPGMQACRDPIKSDTINNGARLTVREGMPV